MITNVQTALRAAFFAAALFPEENVQSENRKFESPSTGLPWASLNFSDLSITLASNGAGGQDRVDGFMQVDLNYPLDEGVGDISDMADQVQELFQSGSYFTHSGQGVTVLSSGRSAARRVDGLLRLSITVRYYAHYNRQI
jgi:hypothetical protein